MNQNQMKAIILSDNGVRFEEVDLPELKPTQVLVRVASSSVNRSDLMTAQGQNFGHVGGSQKVMGASFCGEIVAVGDATQGFSVGDRVMAQGAAGWAEYATADWRRVLPIPAKSIDFINAATLMSSVLTMHNAIVTDGKFVAGQTILIQGASSGVGLMGTQIAKHLGAKLVIGTSTNAEKRAKLSAYGADLVLDSRDPNWVAQVLEATGGAGVNLIIDNISGYVVNQNMAATAIRGTIVNVGRLGGQKTEFDCEMHAERRLTYIGVTGRTRSIEEHAQVTQRAKEDLWDAVRDGKLRVPVDRIFDLKDAAKALEYSASNTQFGRIVLKVGA